MTPLGPEILQRTLEHLLLVAIALGLALLITVPLGLWIHRRRRWAGPVLAATSTIQTIPSLAIFGLLLTVPLLGGIGPGPAVLALTLYALLPLLRGLVTGLAQVPPGLREAGLALGLRPGQVLRRIELPLALPSWMAGLRVATVISVGTATIAAAIGAGGLGVFLFRGIATVNNGLILAGALPAAALALLADGGLGLLERRLARPRVPRHPGPGGRRRGLKGLMALLALAVALALGLAALRPPPAASVRIGAKNFTEQLILGELLAQQIEADTGLRVRRDFGLGGTGLLHEGVRSGRLDGYVEYTGTAWTAILDQPPPRGAGRRQRVWRETRARYADLGLTVFPSLGFENSFAMLIRRADAQRLGLRTLSQAAPVAPGWRAGFGHEFLSRPDGWPGLARRYGLQLAAPPRAMDLGLTYRALAEGQVDLIAGDSTNGLIQALDLAVLADDRGHFPPYDAVPVFGSASLRRHPSLAGAVGRLVGRLDAATMQRLNAAVDLERRPVEAVVRQWRRAAGLDRPPASTPAAGSRNMPARPGPLPP